MRQIISPCKCKIYEGKKVGKFVRKWVTGPPGLHEPGNFNNCTRSGSKYTVSIFSSVTLYSRYMPCPPPRHRHWRRLIRPFRELIAASLSRNESPTNSITSSHRSLEAERKNGFFKSCPSSFLPCGGAAACLQMLACLAELIQRAAELASISQASHRIQDRRKCH